LSFTYIPTPVSHSVLSRCTGLIILPGNLEFEPAPVFYPAENMNRLIVTAFCLLSATATAVGQITVPESVEIGEVFEATWEGEPAEGAIELVKSDGTNRDGGTVRSYLKPGESPQVVKVTAPVEPGEYGLALVRKGQREREHLTVFTVADVEATLEAPDTVGINEEFEVGWSRAYPRRRPGRGRQSEGRPETGSLFLRLHRQCEVGYGPAAGSESAGDLSGRLPDEDARDGGGEYRGRRLRGEAHRTG